MGRIILASTSPRRRELLEKIGIAFEVESPEAEESCRVFPVSCTALENAEKKAFSVASGHPEALVIGADTVIELGSEIIGKPRDPDDAFRILKRLSGKVHHVATGVCLLRLEDKVRIRFVERTAVYFQDLPDETIRRYLSLVHVADKAGAYAVQEHGDMLVERIEGSLDSVIGLPTERLQESLSLLSGKTP